MAPDGGDSLAILLPVPNLRAAVSTGIAPRTGCATRWSRDLERTFGLEGLDASVRVEHRMAPPDFAREFGAVDGNAFAVEPTLHQSAYFRAPEPGRRRARALPRRRRNASGRGHPGRAARRAGDRRAGRRRLRGPPVSAAIAEARATTQRVARTFALACRLLPRAVRDDVYLLYLVFRTLDDLVDERPAGGRRTRRGGGGWAAGRRVRPHRRCEILADARGAARRCPRDALRRLLRRHAPGPRGGRRSRPRTTSTATATASRGPSGVVMASVLGTGALRPRASGRGRARHGDAAHEHPARHRRGRRERARLLRAARRSARHGGARAGPARARCCATRSPAPTRSTTEGSRASASCARGAARSPPPAAMYREVLRQLEREGYGARSGPRRRPQAAQAAQRGRAARPWRV